MLGHHNILEMQRRCVGVGLPLPTCGLLSQVLPVSLCRAKLSEGGVDTQFGKYPTNKIVIKNPILEATKKHSREGENQYVKATHSQAWSIVLEPSESGATFGAEH